MSLDTKVSLHKMKSFKTGLALIIMIFFNHVMVHAQKVMSEGSLVYNISIQTGSKEPNMADMLDGATTTIYIKGNQTRSEMISGLGSESTIHDSRTGTGVILKDYSGQKLMITLTKDDWEKKNKKYEGITYELTSETTTIAGYDCKKAIAKLPDGTSFAVYYSPDLRVANKEYDYPFKTLPGLPMQYEWQSGKMKFKYTLSKVNFDPVPSSKFEIPKSGYRILSYEEAQKK
jgi:GLPGLI family protein